MSTYPKVASALTSAFKTLNDATLQLPVRWPNMPFTPPSTGGWASFDIVPADPAVATLGLQGEDEHTGIMQVGLHYPLQVGVKSVNDAYETLRAFFVAGKFLTFEDARVTVLRCGIGPQGKKDSYFQAFVTVSWRARIQRPTISN